MSLKIGKEEIIGGQFASGHSKIEDTKTQGQAPKKIELKQDMEIKGDLLIEVRQAKDDAEILRDGSVKINNAIVIGKGDMKIGSIYAKDSGIVTRSKPSCTEVLTTSKSDFKDSNKKKQLSNAILEHVKLIRLKKEAELNKSKLKREDKTKPLENCYIPIESYKIMFIISMDELLNHSNINVLHQYESMARELGFDPVTLEHTNVTSILQSIKNNDEKSSRNISCLAFFIVTHEKSKDLVELNGLQKICEETSKFDKIPKLFFIESCRGGILEDDISLKKNLSNEISNLNISETVIAYSTILGPVKETNELIMSSFADIMCQAMLRHADIKEFHQILTRVNNDVSRNKIEVEGTNYESYRLKQMSSFRSSFSKRIFFTI